MRPPIPASLPFVLLLSGCASPGPDTRGAASVASAEAAYLEARLLADEIDIAASRGVEVGSSGRPTAELNAAYRLAYDEAERALRRARPGNESDRRALARMHEAIANEMGKPSAESPASEEDERCLDAREMVDLPGGSAAISEALYVCYGQRAAKQEFEGEILDRLTVFGRLANEPDPERRRGLFHSFLPLWTVVDGDVGSGPHPFRELVRRSAAEWTASGSPVERQLRALGFDPLEFERGLESILEAWSQAYAGEPMEPWDLHWKIGRAARDLRDAVPRDELMAIHRRYYADLGMDPEAIGVRYDLEPREGKTPVAFCNFGSRGRSVDGAWKPTEPWVFATYRTGGFDNLVELLHETGHAVHIAAIRTRPAFLDWPDADAYTEGLGDLLALEAYEPDWQQQYLGRSVALADSLQAKYGSIVMDIAWALFEIRMHRAPEREPNAVWSELMERYFGIRPHPELSWWALRGQLISNPGYMSNYAIGAVIVADLRAAARERRGAFSRPDVTWYPWLSEQLYRQGREVESRVVIESFLGRPPSTSALLADLARATGVH